MASYAKTVTVDTTSLEKFARNLKADAPKISRVLNTELKAAGELVAVEARLKAGWFSSRIPQTIRVTASGAKVTVKAGGAKAPHAAPFENKGERGSFRHPVFGNREVWVSQKAQPFLGPSLAENAEKIAVMVGNALDRALRLFFEAD